MELNEGLINSRLEALQKKERLAEKQSEISRLERKFGKEDPADVSPFVGVMSQLGIKVTDLRREQW